MNCQDFNDKLHEYLDGTLEAGLQAAAGRHLEQCSACRDALLREQSAAESLRHSLEHLTADFSLRPETRRSIEQALAAKPAPTGAWLRAWKWFLATPARPIAAGAACLVLLLVVGTLLRPGTEPPTILQTAPEARTVHAPIQTEIYVFRRQTDGVVDMIVPSVTVGYAHIPETKEPASHPL